MIKILYKIIMILSVAILFLNTAANVIYAAVEVNLNKAYIEKIGQADYHLKYYKSSTNQYTYLICDIVGFYDKQGNFNPAYCMNSDLTGAGKGAYYVKIDSLLNNNKVWRVIKNGYPYKSAKALGLSSKYDAFAVTKFAVYCVLGEVKLEKFKAEEDDKEAVAMLKALKELVDIGKNGTEKQRIDPLSIQKIGDLKQDGDYYFQEYKVNSQSDFSQYEIVSTKGMPKDSYISDSKGNKVSKLSSKENFRIRVPKEQLVSNLDISAQIKAECKSYLIYEGKTTVENTQNYVVTAGESATATANTNLKINTNISSIEVQKISENTKMPLEGVKFELYKDEKLIDTKSTNKDGIIKFENLYPGSYILKETETNKRYVLDEEPVNINVEYSENKKLIISNKAKTGNIKIMKVDKDNNEIRLSGVEFELYDKEEDKMIGNYTTDENGEIFIKDLPIGKYTIKETKTDKWYNLDENEKEIIVSQYETTETKIENETKKGQIKVIKIDSENNKIKLEGVKFEVQDKYGKVLETLITDKNGEATTSKYAVKDYENLYFKETETNSNYVLDEKIKEVKLEENQIKNVTFENKKIKGKIKIIKTSKDDNKITEEKAGTPLESVKFEIYNSKNDLVETVITDKNGVAITSNLEKGKYKIKEIETNKYYYLNQNIVEATIEKNKEEVVVNITNESQNPDIDIEKSGPDTVEVGKTIEYDISVRNTGNTLLDKFTMTDILPSDYINVTKFKTGTYNQDIKYDLYYKTNMTEHYQLLMEDLSTKENYEINFEQELADNEYVTEIQLDFGSVDMGFSSNENPHITGTVRTTVKSEDAFTNIAKVSGEFEGYKVKDKSKWKTVAYKYLPKTGF